jgi:hypothetical protein
MDPATRTRENEDAMDDPYLDNPAWNGRMIAYWAEMKKKYTYAAAHPRIPVLPDPPYPP